MCAKDGINRNLSQQRGQRGSVRSSVLVLSFLLFAWLPLSAQSLDAPRLSSPPNGAMDQPRSLTLTWGTVLGATNYDVHVSTSGAFSDTVRFGPGLPDTSYQVLGLAYGSTYYWRVRALNPLLSLSSAWSGAWSFTTIPEAPSTPALLQPVNGATGQSTTLTLSWQASARASSYHLQVSSTTDFASLLVDDPLMTTTSRQVGPLQSATTYYWRVRASNSGGTSDWSTFWSFTTVVAVPTAPTLLSPASGALNQPTSLTLRWNMSTGATSYRLQVSTSSSFETLTLEDTTLTSTSKVVSSLAYSTTYYWRVNATNSGGTSNWSEVWSFTTIPKAPDTPALSNPANGATDQPTTLTLTWAASTGAERYHLQLSTSSAFTTTTVDDPNITVTSRSVGPLVNGTTYFWRVNATNVGGTSGWSTVWSFTTNVPPPPTPTLAAPSNGSVNQPTALTLRWNPTQGAERYHLQLATDSSFATVVLNDSTISLTSRDVGPLMNGTTYYWRVRATNSGGTSSFSSTWSFTTVPAPPSAPMLSSPANGSFNQPTTITLNWNSSTGATSYRLQVSTNSTFSSTVLDDSTLTATSKEVGPLSNNTTYYWRVNAKNAGGSSPYSETWSFTTAVAPPSAPTLSSPTNGATNQPTTVELRWNATMGAESYRVQVSTGSTFPSTVVDNQNVTVTSLQVGPLSNGTTYYWRVMAKGLAGSSDWSSVWSFSTVPAAPSAPTLSSPANGATSVSTSPTFSWNAATGAVSYHLQLSTQTTFSSTIVDRPGITATSSSVNGLSSGTTYYWRVRASNDGGTGPWSGTWSFTTSAAAPPPPSPPATPTLSTPANGATDLPTTVSLTWNAVTEASSYTLQVSTSSTFVSFVVNQTGLGTTSYTLSNLSNSTTYYWRVSATNAGGVSSWSTVWVFSTAPAAPTAPTLNSPVNGATNISTNPTVRWNASSGAAFYELQVSTSSTFDNHAVDQPNLTTTSHSATGLRENTTYFWRVRARNSGGTSAWSPVWNFRTGSDTPAAPTLVSPANTAADVPTTVTVQWNSVQGAASYRLQVSTLSTFTSTVYDDSTLTRNSQQIGPLATNTTYHWRVRASNTSGTSNWSSVWSFTTVPSAPAAPTLSSPSNGATNQPTTLTLSWESSAGASLYDLQLSETSSFTTLAIDDTSIASTSRQVGPLKNNQTYYWHVRSKNNGGTSAWSSIWRFTTEPPAQNAPSPISPANGATNQPTTITFSWSAVTGANSYHLQVSTTSTFSTIVLNDNNITTTSRQVGSLQNGTMYYWRVRANFLLLAGEWSNIWTFTTIPNAPTTPSLASPANNATDIALPVLLSWNNSPGASSYHVQVAPASSFATIAWEDSSITAISALVSSLANNTRYYWRVRARNAGGWSAFSPAWSFTTIAGQPATVSLNTTIEFPARSSNLQYQPSDYRIIGLPGASDRPINELLGGTADIDWQAYWDNGRPTDYLVKFDGSSVFRFSAGCAFWLIKRGAWTVNTTVPSVPLNANGQAEIRLQSGWNLITNPFTTDVDWSKVQSLNSITEPLFEFNGSFAPSAVLKPFTGYYFFNATNASMLRIPYGNSPSGSMSQSGNVAQSASEQWKVQVILHSGGVIDNTLWLGVSQNAKEGWDPLDVRKPRGPISAPTVFFHRPEWDTLYSAFAADIRSTDGDGDFWDFTVASPNRDEVQLTFNGLESIPTSLEVYLVDSERARYVNLRSQQSYTFWPAREVSTLRMIVGRKDIVATQLSAITKPTEYLLGTNYPNPFNPSTTIPFEISQQSSITLKVYNLLGQEVKTLVQRELEPGRYWFTWRGDNKEGHIVPSGVYIYQLTSSAGITLTRKMVLTK